MMGEQHALTGAVAWSLWITYHPQPWQVTAVGYAVCAGAAVLPDIDHPGSTVTKSMGVLTEILSVVVVAVTGGHRRGTHSLLGCLLFSGAFWGAWALTPSWYGGALLTFLLMLLFQPLVRLLRVRGIVDEIAATLLAIALVWTPGLDLHLLPLGVLIGTLTHLVGDAITVQGVPFLWPWSEKNYNIAWLHAGGPTEMWIIRPLAIVAIPAIPLWEPVHAFLAS